MKPLLQLIKDNAPSIARLLFNVTAGKIALTESGWSELIAWFVIFANGVWTVWENSHLVSTGQAAAAPANKIPPSTPAILLAFLLPLCLFGSGCASVLPGNDPVVVHAQQVKRIAFDTFNTYVTIEKKNRDLLWKQSHEFKHYADRIRSTAPQVRNSFDATLAAYRASKSDSTKTSVQVAIDSLLQALNETQKYLASSAAKGVTK